MDIGKVTIRQTSRTVIADPNFQPKPNVSLTELNDTNITEPEDGDVLIYDAVISKFKSAPLSQAQVDITLVNGGSF